MNLYLNIRFEPPSKRELKYIFCSCCVNWLIFLQILIFGFRENADFYFYIPKDITNIEVIFMQTLNWNGWNKKTISNIQKIHQNILHLYLIGCTITYCLVFLFECTKTKRWLWKYSALFNFCAWWYLLLLLQKGWPPFFSFAVGIMSLGSKKLENCPWNSENICQLLITVSQQLLDL